MKSVGVFSPTEPTPCPSLKMLPWNASNWQYGGNASSDVGQVPIAANTQMGTNDQRAFISRRAPMPRAVPNAQRSTNCQCREAPTSSSGHLTPQHATAQLDRYCTGFIPFCPATSIKWVLGSLPCSPVPI